ncbi:unnamed protein product [Strongylus vulgaris]|uniref:Peptidase C1A papain C-terminal domain-containing protein n=1 Tax=Strongylus vulgaris TaxID=40348 RepID=A0A3P7JXY9_STRVU|nr:unnamed protein product [Strongylus vulgaris]
MNNLGSKAYFLKVDEKEIKKEIFKNGPVQATFQVYDDFRLYKSGIYKVRHKGGWYRGGHAIKIVGWGVENGTKFWNCANSWSKDWGEKGGYFRIVRGVNEVGIEEGVTAGLFRLE